MKFTFTKFVNIEIDASDVAEYMLDTLYEDIGEKLYYEDFTDEEVDKYRKLIFKDVLKEAIKELIKNLD